MQIQSENVHHIADEKCTKKCVIPKASWQASCDQRFWQASLATMWTLCTLAAVQS